MTRSAFDDLVAVAREVFPDKADHFAAELMARLGGSACYVPKRKRLTPRAAPDPQAHRLTASDARRRVAPPRAPRLLR